MMVVGMMVLGDSGTEYTVYPDADGTVHCSCPDHRYRGRECKHIRFLREKVAPMAAAAPSLVSASS